MEHGINTHQRRMGTVRRWCLFFQIDHADARSHLLRDSFKRPHLRPLNRSPYSCPRGQNRPPEVRILKNFLEGY